MGKVLAFIYDDMADFEVTYTVHLLGNSGGKEIITIAYEDKPVKSRGGLVYKPHKTVKEALREEVEGLLITGGWNGEIREELIDLIQKLNEEGKLLAAICAGPRFLAKAGILDKVQYTTSLLDWNETYRQLFNEEDPFPRQNFINQRVFRDRNVITAQGMAFVDFAAEVCDWFNLFGDDMAKEGFLKNIKGI